MASEAVELLLKMHCLEDHISLAASIDAAIQAAVQSEREECVKAVLSRRSSGENHDEWTITRDIAFRHAADEIEKRNKEQPDEA